MKSLLSLALIFGVLPFAAFAQDDVAPGAGTGILTRAFGPQGDNWASIAKLPDLTTGTWLGRMSPGAGPVPAGAAADGRSCPPHAMPGIMSGPLSLEFLYGPGRVTIAIELDHAIRRLYLQPKHDDDPDYSYMGDSIEHWEGNTLVVDTIAIKSQTETPPAHMVERMHLVNPNLLEIDRTDYYGGKPVAHKFLYDRETDRMIEYYCEDNPRDGFDKSGNAAVNTSVK